LNPGRRGGKPASNRLSYGAAIELRHSSSSAFIAVTIKIIFFIYLVCEAIGTAASPGLLCQARVIVKMIVEKQMECRLAGETEFLGENLLQRHFCLSQNPA
jgi:hypothetical protein